MIVPINSEFKDICDEISKMNHSESEWAEIESCDMFQSSNFCGGFEADENEFCFSYFDTKDNEYWFQLDLETANNIANGSSPEIHCSLAQ